MGTVLVIARFAQFAAAMLLFGSSLFRLWFCGRVGVEVGSAIGRFHRRLLPFTAVVAIAASFAWLDIEAGLMGGGWSEAESLQTIWTVLFQTSFGHVWQWTLAFAAILLCVAFVRPSAEQRTVAVALVAGLSGLLIASSAWTGHAVMHRGLAGVIHPLVQVVHVLAAASWLGTLPALGFVLLKARSDRRAEWRDFARSVLRRYSRFGYLAVGLILLTGIANSVFMVDGLAAIFSTLYGRILAVKVSLFLLMVGVAAVNRFILAPAAISPRSDPGKTDEAYRQLYLSVAAEQGLGLAIVAAVSLLGTLMPPMSGHMAM